MLTREEILGYKPELLPIFLADLGGEVYLRRFSSREHTDWRFNGAQKRGESDEAYRKRLQTLCAEFAAVVLCDADGKRLFGDADVPLLADRPGLGPALEIVFERGIEFNRLSPEDVEEAKKNSRTTPPGDSLTG